MIVNQNTSTFQYLIKPTIGFVKNVGAECYKNHFSEILTLGFCATLPLRFPNDRLTFLLPLGSCFLGSMAFTKGVTQFQNSTNKKEKCISLTKVALGALGIAYSVYFTNQIIINKHLEIQEKMLPSKYIFLHIAWRCFSIFGHIVNIIEG